MSIKRELFYRAAAVFCCGLLLAALTACGHASPERVLRKMESLAEQGDAKTAAQLGRDHLKEQGDALSTDEQTELYRKLIELYEGELADPDAAEELRRQAYDRTGADEFASETPLAEPTPSPAPEQTTAADPSGITPRAPQPSAYWNGLDHFSEIRTDLVGVFPGPEEFVFGDKSIVDYTPVELWNWVPKHGAPESSISELREDYLSRYEEFFDMSVSMMYGYDSERDRMHLGAGVSWYQYYGPSGGVEIVMPRGITMLDNLATVFQKLGLPAEDALLYGQQTYVKIYLYADHVELYAADEGRSMHEVEIFYEEGYGDFCGVLSFGFDNSNLYSYSVRQFREQGKQIVVN